MILSKSYAQHLIRCGKATLQGATIHQDQRYAIVVRHDINRVDHYLDDDEFERPQFLRSEDCGYSPGRLLLDMPCGDTISIRKNGREWLETRIRNGIAIGAAKVHTTKRDALQSASSTRAAESI